MTDAEDIAAAEDFYKEDRKKLDSIKRVEFTPVQPYVYVDEDPWYVQVYYAIWRWCHHDLPYYHKDLRNGVRNLWRWAPFIWCDRNWDHGYLDEMILKKLKYMKPELEVHVIRGPHHDALDRCILLLEEMIKLDGCKCHRLAADCDSLVAHGCYEMQADMRREFGELFAAFSQSWWD